jgi:uncharacterized protein YkwD
MKQPARSIASLLATAVLSGCGGGGSVPAPVPAPTTASVPAPAAVAPAATVTPPLDAFSNLYQTLQTSVAPTTYSGRDLEEFTTLNRLRALCGFGVLTSNESLRAATTDHAKYVDTNGNKVLAAGLSLHEQFPQFPDGFTGFTVADRARFRGYLSPTFGEVIAGSVASKSAVHGLLSAPYHAGATLGGQTEVGIASRSSIVMDFGLPGKRQRSGNSILTYPCNGVTDTQISLSAETPMPYSPRNLLVSPIGQAVYFFADESVRLAPGRKTLMDITHLSMTEAVSGTEVVMLPVMNRETDPNFIYLSTGFAYAAPDKPLKPLTAYRVRATVTANGKTTPIDYTFTTGTGTR